MVLLDQLVHVYLDELLRCLAREDSRAWHGAVGAAPSSGAFASIGDVAIQRATVACLPAEEHEVYLDHELDSAASRVAFAQQQPSERQTQRGARIAGCLLVEKPDATNGTAGTLRPVYTAVVRWLAAQN